MTAPAAPAVHLHAARLERGGRTILSGLDLVVPKGSITAILGPSGSGKSTLLAALTGELPVATGTLEIFGQPIPHGARALLEMRKGLGVLLQGNGLLTDLTVAENVALPLRTHTKLPEPVLQALVRFAVFKPYRQATEELIVRDAGKTRENALLGEILPKGLSFDVVNRDMTKKTISATINECYRTLGLKHTVVFADQLMYTGFHYAMRSGSSVGFTDMKIPDEKAGILDGREETFVAEIPEAKAAGATSVEVILYDRAGNAASARVPLK